MGGTERGRNFPNLGRCQPAPPATMDRSSSGSLGQGLHKMRDGLAFSESGPGVGAYPEFESVSPHPKAGRGKGPS